MIRRILILISAASLLWACGMDINEPMKKDVVTRDIPDATYSLPGRIGHNVLPDAEGVRTLTPVDDIEDVEPIEDPVIDDDPVTDDPIEDPVDDTPEIIETDRPLTHFLLVPTPAGPMFIETTDAFALGTTDPDVTSVSYIGTIQAFSDEEIEEQLEEVRGLLEPGEILKVVRLPDFERMGRKSAGEQPITTTAVTLDSVMTDLPGSTGFLITNQEHECSFDARHPGWVIAPQEVHVDHSNEVFNLDWDHKPGSYAVDLNGSYTVEPDVRFGRIADYVDPLYVLDTALVWNEDTGRYQVHLSGLAPGDISIMIHELRIPTTWVSETRFFEANIEPDGSSAWVRMKVIDGAGDVHEGSFFLIRTE